MTASRKSTVFSSAGEDATGPGVPTFVVGAAPPPPPTSDRKSTPVAQLSNRSTTTPPIPIGIARMPPELPRMSSMFPRSPDVHFIQLTPSGDCACKKRDRPQPGDCTRTGGVRRGNNVGRCSFDPNLAPFTLLEARDREEAARRVADEDGGPDAGR